MEIGLGRMDRAAAGTSSGATSRSGEQTNSNASASGTDAATSITTPGETTSSSSSRGRDRTLDDVMRDPSTILPGVVVLESMPEGVSRKEVLDPKEDLWLSTADGRFSSPVIPLHVGVEPHRETFYVHKDVLTKSKYFERALCGDFREARTQSVDLPEENPAIFHFIIAYLYEGKYHPIKPVASVLVADPDKGKGKEGSQETGGDSDSDESVESYNSDVSAASRNRRERRRRREDRLLERMRQKRPGTHRPTCGCPQCLSALGPPCWHCRAPRAMPPPPPMPPQQPGMVIDHRDYMVRQDRQRRPPRRRHGAGPGAGPITPPPPPGSAPHVAGPPARISGEDLRTWLLAYELNIDVYILANKFMLDGFKTEIARAAIDMLETAGTDAAVPDVLYLCRKLYDGLSENDNLLKMIFARVGFLQPWRTSPEETNAFLVANPGIAPLLLREMASRRNDEALGRSLPSMERPWYPPAGIEPAGPHHYRAAPHHHPYYNRGPPRW
ncbi:hypothetical protein QBC39DRAFT_64893 [Podospora conica]|nr:hypothetical protein QBC39DRAFT_64893 [Schizothecium conicum]